MSWFFEHLYHLSEKDAIADNNGIHSYLDLHNAISEYQDLVERKISSGEIVVVLSDYNFYSIALFLALFNKKCILVPIVTNIEDEVSRRIEVSKATKIIQIDSDGALKIDSNTPDDFHPLISDLVEQNYAGLILFSSGITGKPKAMIHNLDLLVNTFQGKKIKNLNILVFLMFDHIGGINTLLNALAMGTFIVLPVNRSVENIAILISRYKVNILPSSPTFLNMMLIEEVHKKYDLSSLKMITYGTETMPESLLKRIKTSFPKVRLLQTFGTSETGIMKTSSKSSNSLEMKLNDPNQEYKVVNQELWLRSKTQVLGYLNAEMDSFTEDGWFRTGDLVDELDDGYIRIIGRGNEIINVGGEKVLPSEVESILLEMDVVQDAIVYGNKNAITGQNVVADIVLKDSHCEKPKKEIRKHCRARLSSYKVPSKINFISKAKVNDRFKKLRSK